MLATSISVDTVKCPRYVRNVTLVPVMTARGDHRVVVTLVWDLDPGEAGEQLQRREARVQVRLPRRDQAVAHQVDRAHEQRMRGVCGHRMSNTAYMSGL